MSEKDVGGSINPIYIVVILLIVVVTCLGICGPIIDSDKGGGGPDLDSPAWDSYFDCLEGEENAGTPKTTAYEFCKRLRPD